MVIMALDHTRDFFTDFHYSPTDLQHASTVMFLTRWITHYCAPLFIFLSGTSAFLSISKGKSKKQAAFHLLTRGLWLILLEFTLVHIGWQFNVGYNVVVMQVIWAIGCSMIALAGLIFLPIPALATLSLLIIFGHNALDSISAESFGDNAPLWNLLHQNGQIPLGNSMLFIIYPLIPWIAVMAIGYCFGKLLQQPLQQRNRSLYTVGISAINLFILLRFANVYGDPRPWQAQATWSRTVLSFIDCTKYPPSLLYLLMTIGPGITLMPLLENARNAVARFFTVFGKVPMFYYILHIYVIHGLALLTGISMGLPASYFINDMLFNASDKWGFSLDIVYGFWVLAILLLYLPSRWWMGIKQRYRHWWLSYL
jgi:uncharacterized membrane protein